MISLPYGSWPSPLALGDLTAGSRQLDEVRIDGRDTYWLEGRPWENGRVVLVRHRGATGAVDDVVGPEANVRSRVHEYGGGAYDVRSGLAVVTTMPDLGLHVVESDGTLRTIAAGGAVRYGGLVLGEGFVLAVREDHSGDGEPVNTVVRLHLSGDASQQATVLWQGSDFVGRPALSADGTQVAIVTWDHPNMPWDTSTVRRAALDASGVGEWTIVADTDGVSVGQPRFSPGGSLWFVSDESGWWNLHREAASGEPSAPVHKVEADLMQPQWVLGMSDYAFLDEERVLIHWWADGVGRLGVLDAASGRLDDAGVPGVQFDQLTSDGDEIVVRVGGPAELPTIVRGPVGGEFRTLRRSREAGLDPAAVGAAEPWTWTNSSGAQVHGLFLAPASSGDTEGPAGALPPLLVFVHGGPTGRAEAGLQLMRAFWTTRGVAVLDVNHSGSTGHGRAYRDRLQGQWGVLDNDDIVTGARSLASAGRVDGERLAIRGGSAGGYAVLRALTTSEAFAAGTSYFGVADLEALAADTHKFESRYLDGLIGPYPASQDVYVDRSPIHHLDSIHGAVLLLQGGIDEVVPSAQAEAMAEGMRAAGRDVELVLYPDEGHGFRAASAIEDSLARELAFYGRVFGFTPSS